MELTFLFTIAMLFSCTIGYNLEGRLPLYKSGGTNSTFGFSVALHKLSIDPGSSLEKSLLVVGSPTAEALPSQTNAVKPGGIYHCPVSTNSEDCTRVDMDLGESSRTNNKTGQWLGVSLKSQGAGKYLITCAHRHSMRLYSRVNEVERLCGKCFLLNGTDANGLTEITPSDVDNRFIASPCDQLQRANTLSKNNLGYSQSGVSLSLIDNEYLLGGPGMWSWTGGMFDIQMADLEATEALDIFTSSTAMYETLGCYKNELDRGKVKCDNIPLRRDSYLGFSVASSNAIKPGETTYVAGAPRGNYTGAIVMYRKISDGLSKSLAPILTDTILGEFIGSGFGFSVATIDVNGDGLDDLLVGAPQYYEYSNEGKHGGAVYVYINQRGVAFSQITPKKLLGSLDSFFGYSIASVGDIDQDGYIDFAVGAPQEKPNGKVYIFRGSADGNVKQSQVFNGANFTDIKPDVKGFGVSLSGAVDIDNNKYPDLLVGTLSDYVVLLRSRPVISIESSLSASPTSLDLRNPNCTLGSKTYSCFELQFCFRYNARHQEYTEILPIHYSITLDSELQKERKAARVAFASPQGPSLMSDVANVPRAGQWYCPGGKYKVFFIGSEDRLRPIKIDFEFDLASEINGVKRERPDQPVFNMINDPIMDADFPHARTSVVNLANNCGDDGCQSNLKLRGSIPPEVVIGRDSKMLLSLNVTNDGEEAHQAVVSAKLPAWVYYDNYTVTSSSGAEIVCTTSDIGGSTFVVCTLGNPYVEGSADIIDILLDVQQLTADTKQIVIEVTGSTTSINPEIPPTPLYSDVIIQMMLSLSGYGKPQQVRYVNAPIKGESAIHFTNEIGPFVEYTFTVKNDGLQLANGVRLIVDFPIEIKNGKWLMYLVSAHVRSGGLQIVGECEQHYQNTLHFKLPVTSSVSAARRTKREAKASSLYEPRRLSSTQSGSNFVTLDCHGDTARCVKIGCTLDPIQPGSTTSVNLQARLWNNTFLEEFIDIDLVNVAASATVSNIDSNVRITGSPTHETLTTVDHAYFEVSVKSSFPWWYILIGILIALIIYIIIIYLLIKCGFFKRKKYPRDQQHAQDDNGAAVAEEEKEPTNRETAT
ncbi:integrin alpha-6 isoform X1 [Ciona intestinalis]